jgi:hypothetical protein
VVKTDWYEARYYRGLRTVDRQPLPENWDEGLL